LTVQGQAVAEILHPGLGVSIQDGGRPGYARLGVPRSGAADRRSFTLANRLLGDDPEAAVLECVLSGLRLTLSDGRNVAVTGAAAEVRVAGRPVRDERRFWVPAGHEISVQQTSGGIYSYLAIAGGLAVEAVLGSRSRDSLTGLGPAALQAGSMLALGPVSSSPTGALELAYSRLPRAARVIRFRWGPRADVLNPVDRRTLIEADWLVSSESNRVGTRLSGPTLAPAKMHLPSEGMMLGAIQLPPGGQPIVFLADHPVTGGYPVVGVVLDDDVDLIAQAVPGTVLNLRPVPLRRRWPVDIVRMQSQDL
jgi:biotin-dependent carboxylase-like uncharacterized protein